MMCKLFQDEFLIIGLIFPILMGITAFLIIVIKQEYKTNKN